MNIAFYLLSLLIIISGLGVIAAKNPINSALFLILNLLCVAGMFALLNAHFLAAVQIVVYAGAIMVLVLFVLMLLNVKAEGEFGSSITLVSAAAAVGILFLCAVAPILVLYSNLEGFGGVQIEGTVKAIGELLYSKYVFTFEAASVLIMAAIVGAVMLAKRKYVSLAERK